MTLTLLIIGYDSRGNITSNGQRSFVFNRANLLASSGSISYSYDGHGRRVLKNDNGAKTYSLYNSQGVLMSTYESGGYTDYFYLGSQLVAKYNDPNTQSDKPGYTGHVEDDDLQLTYMQARYYDSVIGRFYSNDPVGFNASNPMLFNRYAYANNNPYKYIDPDGKEPINFNSLFPQAREKEIISQISYGVMDTAKGVPGFAGDAMLYVGSGTGRAFMANSGNFATLAGFIPGYGALVVATTFGVLHMVETGSFDALAGLAAGELAKNQLDKVKVPSRFGPLVKWAGAQYVSNEATEGVKAHEQNMRATQEANGTDSGGPPVVQVDTSHRLRKE
tara:strand:- start:688 stop:1686 length:999 start_codon:yes stop_codon:yes gene_type:complete